jgi:hypothetical protein
VAFVPYHRKLLRVVEGRYRVQIAVVAFNQEAADMIFCRLIEGSTQTKDALVMDTSVYVTLLFSKNA